MHLCSERHKQIRKPLFVLSHNLKIAYHFVFPYQCWPHHKPANSCTQKYPHSDTEMLLYIYMSGFFSLLIPSPLVSHLPFPLVPAQFSLVDTWPHSRSTGCGWETLITKPWPEANETSARQQTLVDVHVRALPLCSQPLPLIESYLTNLGLEDPDGTLTG